MSESIQISQAPSSAPDGLQPVSVQPSNGGVKAFLLKLARFMTTTGVALIAISFSTTILLAATAVHNILIGIVLVSAWDALVDRSLASLPALNTVLPLYWHHLRAAWLGSALLGDAVGIVGGIGTAAYKVYFAPHTRECHFRMGFSESRKLAQEEITMQMTRRPRAVVSAAVALAGTAAMAIGIAAIRWWIGSSIDEVTANPVRSVIVAFVGYATWAGCVFIRRKRGTVRLEGEDMLPVSHGHGEREGN